jgi:DNA-binding XRE family transcriptional regulator
VRCLKRYVAREIYRLLVDPPPVTSAAELRAWREALGISQHTAAASLGVTYVTIYRFERETTRSTELGLRYEAWLSTIAPRALHQAA